MTSSEHAKKFAALVKRLHAAHDAPPADPAHASRPEHLGPLLWQLVFSILAWECSPARAAGVAAKLHAAVVDYNEMRVCLPDELASIIGERYPKSHERAQRLRSTLNDIFKRQHAVTLDHLSTLNKREARAYLESLAGCPPFAAARVALLELEGHAMPLDARLHEHLRAEEAVPTDLDTHGVASWIERQLRAGEARATYLALEAWAADRPPPPRAEARPVKDAGEKPKPARTKRSSDQPRVKKQTKA